MNYPITQKYIKYNRSYAKLAPSGMVLHDTDTKGATDQNEQDYFNKGIRLAAAHAFIDWDSITETVPLDEQAWHAGGTANHSMLGVELCVPAAHNPVQFQEVWNRAVWYFAHCFINTIRVNTITKDNLMSHAEVSAKWHETDHQDPIVYFAEYGKTVNQFRSEVQKEINNLVEDLEMKKIVTYLGDSDLFAAVLVSQKNSCPLMKKADFDASGLKADQVIAVGGKPNSTRFSTFKDAAALV